MNNESLSQYNGKILIKKIDNQRFNRVDISTQTIKDLNVDDIKYVYYPDSQQLIIWLPNSGHTYQSLRINNLSENLLVLNCPVSDKLNGNVQLILDTLFFSPANYSLQIEMEGFISHTIWFTKLEEQKEFPIHLPNPETPIYSSNNFENRRRYHDSAGNYIGDDLDFRERKMNELLSKLSPSIEYNEQGRSGTIYYIDVETRISFDYEFGGGNCIVYIIIPNKIYWESETKTPILRRDEIIEFVASKVHQEKVGNSKMVITEDAISYYSN